MTHAEAPLERFETNCASDAETCDSERGDRPEGRCHSLTTEERTQLVHQLGTVYECRQKLLRKEVIQPHLPVRLPCYDFTPIANPTFDSSLPKGLGHWLRVLPTFVV